MAKIVLMFLDSERSLTPFKRNSGEHTRPRVLVMAPRHHHLGLLLDKKFVAARAPQPAPEADALPRTPHNSPAWGLRFGALVFAHGSSNYRNDQERSLYCERAGAINGCGREQISRGETDGPLPVRCVHGKAILRRNAFKDWISSSRKGRARICREIGEGS